ncbi:hypothetical protein [Streptomyces sp. NPDC046859]|uniref:hypothetical protein n=1 Tax=Streptomyces sp. NPDC046859 TaxID=3155734 RepID=UPI0033C63450
MLTNEGMPGMTSKETISYVAHHLKIAGRPDHLFTEDALTLIHLSLQAPVATWPTGKNLVDESRRPRVRE